MKKLSADAINALKNRLDELPTRHNTTPYAVVQELFETISSVRARGYDIDDVVTLLAEVGVQLSRNTVRNYISRARKERQLGQPSTRPPLAPGITGQPPEENSREEMVVVAAAEGSRTSFGVAVRGQLDHARVLEQARKLRGSSTRTETSLAPGSFALVPDKDL